MNVFDFLATQSGSQLLGICGAIVNIVAAILTGAALRNISQVRKMVGGIVKPGLLKRLFGRRKHEADAPVDAKPDAFQSLTLAEKVDMLKNNQELLWVRQGIDSADTTARLDRVDPPNRRH